MLTHRGGAAAEPKWAETAIWTARESEDLSRISSRNVSSQELLPFIRRFRKDRHHRRRVRGNTRAPAITDSWSWAWPGLSDARSRKPVELVQRAAATAAALEGRLSPPPSTALRDAVFVGTLVAALRPGERERLFGAGTIAGLRWQPTPDARLNALLREWVFGERATQAPSTLNRDAGGVSPRICRPSEVLRPTPRANAPAVALFERKCHRSTMLGHRFATHFEAILRRNDDVRTIARRFDR